VRGEDVWVRCTAWRIVSQLSGGAQRSSAYVEPVSPSAYRARDDDEEMDPSFDPVGEEADEAAAGGSEVVEVGAITFMERQQLSQKQCKMHGGDSGKNNCDICNDFKAKVKSNGKGLSKHIPQRYKDHAVSVAQQCKCDRGFAGSSINSYDDLYQFYKEKYGTQAEKFFVSKGCPVHVHTPRKPRKPKEKKQQVQNE
jgi:hypothetical protein